MNEKLISQAYAKVQPIVDNWDKTTRARRKLPRWRKAASWLGWKKPLAVWLIRWERRHGMALHAAKKAAARAYIEAGQEEAKRRRAEKAKERLNG